MDWSDINSGYIGINTMKFINSKGEKVFFKPPDRSKAQHSLFWGKTQHGMSAMTDIKPSKWICGSGCGETILSGPDIEDMNDHFKCECGGEWIEVFDSGNE